jgi:hypothetical protein
VRARPRQNEAAAWSRGVAGFCLTTAGGAGSIGLSFIQNRGWQERPPASGLAGRPVGGRYQDRPTRQLAIVGGLIGKRRRKGFTRQNSPAPSWVLLSGKLV